MVATLREKKFHKDGLQIKVKYNFLKYEIEEKLQMIDKIIFF